MALFHASPEESRVEEASEIHHAPVANASRDRGEKKRFLQAKFQGLNPEDPGVYMRNEDK